MLCWLDQCRRDLVRQSPANDGKTRGTIALRSPVIDPTGTSIVRLLQRDGAVLLVRGLDSLDGTPLLDIKPERSRFQPLAPAQPGDDEISR